jgi:hypothetical protein
VTTLQSCFQNKINEEKTLTCLTHTHSGRHTHPSLQTAVTAIQAQLSKRWYFQHNNGEPGSREGGLGEGKTETETETERQRQRQRETERDREREIGRNRER